MSEMVLIPYGSGFLRLTPDEFTAVMQRGLAQGPNAAPAQPPLGSEALLDSRAMGELLGVPDTWVEQAAKTGEIPFVRVGKKYLRFDAREVMNSLRSGHADYRTATHVQQHDKAGEKQAHNRRTTTAIGARS
jgi:excisionase family DNA binding protein